MNRADIYDDETVREAPYATPILSKGDLLIRDGVRELLLDSRACPFQAREDQSTREFMAIRFNPSGDRLC